MTAANRAPHAPVMLQEMLAHFAGRTLKTFVDGTVGAAGHARALLEAHPEIERMVVCDQDPTAIGLAEKNLAPWKGKVEIVHSNFSNIESILQERGIEGVDGFFLI